MTFGDGDDGDGDGDDEEGWGSLGDDDQDDDDHLIDKDDRKGNRAVSVVPTKPRLTVPASTLTSTAEAEKSTAVPFFNLLNNCLSNKAEGLVDLVPRESEPARMSEHIQEDYGREEVLNVLLRAYNGGYGGCIQCSSGSGGAVITKYSDLDAVDRVHSSIVAKPIVDVRAAKDDLKTEEFRTEAGEAETKAAQAVPLPLTSQPAKFVASARDWLWIDIQVQYNTYGESHQMVLLLDVKHQTLELFDPMGERHLTKPSHDAVLSLARVLWPRFSVLSMPSYWPGRACWIDDTCFLMCAVWSLCRISSSATGMGRTALASVFRSWWSTTPYGMSFGTILCVGGSLMIQQLHEQGYPEARRLYMRTVDLIGKARCALKRCHGGGGGGGAAGESKRGADPLSDLDRYQSELLATYEDGNFQLLRILVASAPRRFPNLAPIFLEPK